MPYKVGLTGGIGSGKSTVTQAFADLDVPTFSADAIGHALSRKGQAAYAEIIRAFGPGILQADGELDRGALGDIVFNDKAQKTRLERILHPIIMQAMHQQADATSAPYCILDIPLLINSAERKRVDRVLVVDCDRETRIARIQARNGWSEEKIHRVMHSQPGSRKLLEAADEVLDNNGTLANIATQVAALHRRYLLVAQA